MYNKQSEGSIKLLVSFGAENLFLLGLYNIMQLSLFLTLVQLSDSSYVLDVVFVVQLVLLIHLFVSGWLRANHIEAIRPRKGFQQAGC